MADKTGSRKSRRSASPREDFREKMNPNMKRYIIANWKMNPSTLQGAQKLFDRVQKGLKKLRLKNMKVVICPPFVFLSNVNGQLSNVKLGAQNCFWEEKGAYTGEVSPLMLNDAGCEYVILGHSERRIHFGETDEMIVKKVKAALAAGLKVILCVGENKDQRQAGQTKQILEGQLGSALSQLSNVNCQMLLVTYEPIWAISSFNGNAATKETTMEAVGWIRGWLKKHFEKNANTIPVLYGGSVNAENAKEHIVEAGADGVLVGSASLDPEEFLQIIEIGSKEAQ